MSFKQEGSPRGTVAEFKKPGQLFFSKQKELTG